MLQPFPWSQINVLGFSFRKYRWKRIPGAATISLDLFLDFGFVTRSLFASEHDSGQGQVLELSFFTHRYFPTDVCNSLHTHFDLPAWPGSVRVKTGDGWEVDPEHSGLLLSGPIPSPSSSCLHSWQPALWDSVPLRFCRLAPPTMSRGHEHNLQAHQLLLKARGSADDLSSQAWPPSSTTIK